GGGKTVVVTAGVNDSFDDAKADTTGEAQDAGGSPIELLVFAEPDDHGKRFGNFFTEADAAGKSQEAEQEIRIRVVGGAVGIADEFHDVKQQHDDAAARDPDAFRDGGHPLKGYQRNDADGRRYSKYDKPLR